MSLALIDLDAVVYRVGFACDNHHYRLGDQTFETKKELDLYLKNNYDEEVAGGIPFTEEIDPEPWDETKMSVITYVEDLLHGFQDFKGFISGESNFRYILATIKPYKGNRPSTRPTHYDDIRQLLVDLYNVKIAEGIEADDELGLAQTEDTIIVSPDKDLDIVPGEHKDMLSKSTYTISNTEGYRNFFKQMLTGDTTDNIPGLYGVGPKSKLIKEVMGMDNLEDMRNYVFNQYESRFHSYAPLFFKENAQLLWILHSRPNPIVEGEYWKI